MSQTNTDSPEHGTAEIFDSILGPADPRFAQLAKELDIETDDLWHFAEYARDIQNRIAHRRSLEDELRSVPPELPESLAFHDIEPADESLPAAELLPLLMGAIRRHVVLDGSAALIIALWLMHTHAVDAFSVTPRLAIRSTGPQTGKTTLLSVLSHLVARPLDLCAGAPAAILASLVYKPTLLIDDAAPLLAGSRDLRALIRNGRQRRGAYLLRNLPKDTLKIGLFSAAALTIEGALPRCPAGRSIEILLERRKRGETVTRLYAKSAQELELLARKLARWAAGSQEALRKMNYAAEN